MNVCCSVPKQLEINNEVQVVDEGADDSDRRLEYGIEDTPAFHLCILFGLQVNINEEFTG